MNFLLYEYMCSQLCALAVPFTPLPYFLEHWPFGVVICHVLVC